MGSVDGLGAGSSRRKKGKLGTPVDRKPSIAKVQNGLSWILSGYRENKRHGNSSISRPFLEESCAGSPGHWYGDPQGVRTPKKVGMARGDPCSTLFG